MHARTHAPVKVTRFLRVQIRRQTEIRGVFPMAILPPTRSLTTSSLPNTAARPTSSISHGKQSRVYTAKIVSSDSNCQVEGSLVCVFPELFVKVFNRDGGA